VCLTTSSWAVASITRVDRVWRRRRGLFVKALVFCKSHCQGLVRRKRTIASDPECDHLKHVRPTTESICRGRTRSLIDGLSRSRRDWNGYPGRWTAQRAQVRYPPTTKDGEDYTNVEVSIGVTSKACVRGHSTAGTLRPGTRDSISADPAFGLVAYFT
jgi:hypothetical protein